jgi:hypothetical protein
MEKPPTGKNVEWKKCQPWGGGGVRRDKKLNICSIELEWQNI